MMASAWVWVVAGLAVIVTFVGLTLFGGLYTPSQSLSNWSGIGLNLAGIGIAIMALAYAMDALDKTRHIMAGEVNQKLAMLYNYADWVSGWKKTDNHENAVKRILADVDTMFNMKGSVKKNKAAVQEAEDSLLKALKKGASDADYKTVKDKFDKLLS
jgi:hypothetical protein